MSYLVSELYKRTYWWILTARLFGLAAACGLVVMTVATYQPAINALNHNNLVGWLLGTSMVFIALIGIAAFDVGIVTLVIALPDHLVEPTKSTASEQTEETTATAQTTALMPADLSSD